MSLKAPYQDKNTPPQNRSTCAVITPPGGAGKSHMRLIDVSCVSRRYRIIRARSTPRCYQMLSDAC